MTLRDLLRHTSGLPNNVTTDRALRKAEHPSLADSTLEEMMNRLDAVPLRYAPGQDWHYSFAADVVARLVEIGSGQPIDKALADLVFKPLGMVDTGFYVPKEKWDRFVVAYGNGLKPVSAPQPGTTGGFTFEKPPKFLSAAAGSFDRGRLHAILPDADRKRRVWRQTLAEGGDRRDDDAQPVARGRQ